ncbi:MAG: TRAP transporter substrate-binding protein [Burkholderiales bacterium]
MPIDDKGGAVRAVASRASNSGRRRFIATAAGGAIAGFPMIALAQPTVVLRMQGAWSAKDIFHEYALDFAKKINDMAGGRLRVDMLPAGAMLKPQDLQDAVHRGVIDGCHAVSAFWHDRNHAFSLFGAAPAMGADANSFLGWMRYGGGMDFYTELVHRQLNLNVVPFFTGPMPAQPLGWFRKPVKSPDDFKGLRIRSSGLAAEMLREMGAVPVALADQDVAAAMKRGDIDAAEINNPSSDRGLGMPDAAKTCMLRSYHQTGEVFEVLINRTKFMSLPAELQAMVRHAADAASADMSWKALQRYPEDYAAMRDRQGVQFQRTPASVLRAQLKAWENVVRRTASTNPFFEKIWKSQQAWVRRTAGWSRENAPDAAMAHEFWFGGARRKPQT